MKHILTIAAISLVLISCNEKTKPSDADQQSQNSKQTLVANYKSLEVEIEGMTCEIGCAKIIQSKLSKVEGITYSKVSFEAKKGEFTYDANLLNKEDIINKIAGIGGGDLYSVTKTTELAELIEPVKN